MKKNPRYVIFDSPLEDAAVCAGSDDKADMEKLAAKLNKINLRVRGPWAGGRYWVDENPSIGR